MARFWLLCATGMWARDTTSWPAGALAVTAGLIAAALSTNPTWWLTVLLGAAGAGAALALASLRARVAAAERAARGALERHRRVLAVASSGICLVDERGKIARANRAAERLLGYPPGGLEGVEVEALVPESSRVAHAGWRAELTADGRGGKMSSRREVRALRRDGTEVAVEITLEPFASDGDHLVYVDLRDASDALAADLARARERVRFVKLSQATTDLVWEWDVAADTIWLSESAFARYGWKVEGLVDRQWMRDRIHPEDLPRLAASLGEVRDGQASWTCEYRFLRADGVYRDMLLRAGLEHDSGGALARVIGIMFDLTDRLAIERALRDRTTELERSNAELERSNAELERFAHVASHDLQEPLRTISSFVQLLAKRLGLEADPDTRRYLAYVVDSAQRMRALIEALLTYSRVDRAQPTAESVVELDDVLQQVRADLGAALERNGASLTADRLPAVTGNRAQLAQLLQNLIGNALKYRRDCAPRIHLSAQPSGPLHWRISIVDNGLGIEARYFEKIFTVFQRLHPADAYEGTGIGLAICKRIVERHGGRIWLESEPGRGSTFHLTLRRAEGDCHERVA